MYPNVMKLFNSYIDNDVMNSTGWLNSFTESFLSYHRIDMIYYYICLKSVYESPFHTQLNEKKKLIEEKNKRFYEIAQLLTEKLNGQNIPHVFLKGISCILDIYPEKWLRYFGDVDFLTEKPYLVQVEKILLDMGYIYGSTTKNSAIIRHATRKDILFQRAFTHEMYNMTKKENENWASDVDVNFLFAWKFQNFMVNDMVSQLKNHIIKRDGIAIFDRIVNIIHLCCHLYSEAVFFALDRDFLFGDPVEIKLNRVFDIGILSMMLSTDEIADMVNLSIKMNCLHKIRHAFKMVNILLQNDFTKGNVCLLDDYDKIDVDAYYTKDQKLASWPISLSERVFDLELKREIASELFPSTPLSTKAQNIRRKE